MSYGVWQKHRTMTPGQYLQTIKLLGLSKAAAGRFLGVCERTSYRYADGDTPIPEASALLLRAMVYHGEDPIVPRPGRED